LRRGSLIGVVAGKDREVHAPGEILVGGIDERQKVPVVLFLRLRDVRVAEVQPTQKWWGRQHRFLLHGDGNEASPPKRSGRSRCPRI
jgi:hypothetical protein